jgi:hypothetical protein
VYLAHRGGGDTRIVTLDGRVRAEFDRQRIVEIVTRAAAPIGPADIRVLDQYDAYYLDRQRRRPLPVIMITLNDDEHGRYYVDPKTARVVGTYSSRDWVERWLYHGLHSLDFPWLYNHRPAWDIVVITFMLGGTALAVTSLVMAWRVLGRSRTRSSAAGGVSGGSFLSCSAECTEADGPGRYSGVQFPDRPHFDASLACRRNPRGRLDRVVQVSRLDQVEARELLLRLDEGAIRDRELAIPDSNGRRRLDGLKGLRGDHEPALPEQVTAAHELAIRHGL